MSRPSAPVAVYADMAEMGTDPGRSMLEAAGWLVREAECRTEEDVAAVVGDATALLVAAVPVTRSVLAHAPHLKIVVTASVGFDHIDVEAADRRGIWVANVPDAATQEVASHALAMALAMIRHLPFLDRSVRQGEWACAATGVPPRTADATLAIVGLGRIGRTLASMARPVFGTIVGHDPAATPSDPPEGVELVDLDEAFTRADVVSLHVPLTAGTRHMVDARRLALMRAGGYLVNVSRGDLIDTDALLDALQVGRLTGAALDVVPVEPPPVQHPLLRHPRILVTPHAAYLSRNADRAYLEKQAGNVLEWAATARPRNAVSHPSGAPA
jgi:phosphoglycerate dehydrogenase-like enzyme